MKFLIFVVFCMLLLVACNSPEGYPEVYEEYEREEMIRSRRITASQARGLMEKYPNAIILDVRNDQEFYTGHIPGAILLPEFEIGERYQDILKDKYQLILVYCRSGVRSRNATNLLLSLGFVNVYDFGGIIHWPYDVTR